VLRFVAVFLSGMTALAPSAWGSTAAVAVSGEAVYFGYNQDHVSPAYIWYFAPERGRNGRVSFGYKDGFAWSSMNDQGLVFASMTVPVMPWSPARGTSTVGNIAEIIMNTCATVEEALEVFERHHTRHFRDTQYLLADSTGAAVAVSGLPGGELSVVHRDMPTLVLTNERLEVTPHRSARHVRAEQVLAGAPASLEQVRSALEATYQQGGLLTTVSVIYEPAAGRFHLYHAADFEKGQTIVLAEAFEGPRRPTPVKELFGADGRDLNELRQRAPRLYDTRVPLATEALSEYAGEYLGDGGVIGTIAVQDGALHLKRPQGSAVKLWPEGKDRFRMENGHQAYFFRDGGTVNGLSLSGEGAPRYAIRKPM